MLDLLHWICLVLFWFGEEPRVVCPAAEWMPPVAPSSPGRLEQGPTDSL